MKPSEKTEQMEQTLTNLFGFDRREFINKDVCISCGKSASEFKDEISRREFQISGLCFSCQQSVFGSGDDY